MSIVVNARFLSRPVTGVERYAREILRRLPGGVRLAQPRDESRGARGHAWEQFCLPGALDRNDLLWSPANTGPLRISNQVLTLHDLSCLEHPEWYAPAFALWNRTVLPVLIRRVRHVVVSSEHVRKKVVKRFGLSPERVTVVPGAVDLSRFRHKHAAKRRSSTRYVLFVGSLQPRKNLGVLLQAWERVARRFREAHLIISGSGGPVFRKAALPGDLERVRFLGYVPEADLPDLYAGALAFVLPSLDEGFGLPVLEAMACHAPVIAANAGALPEVVGDAGLLVDPRSAAGLAASLEDCLSDSDLRRRLVEKGRERVNAFSWERSAEKMWEVIDACR